jgi:acyl carrier protein
MTQTANTRLEELREIVAEVLEVEPHEIEDDAHFQAVYGADSLRAIEVLARIEKRYKIDVPQSELANMVNLTAVYAVVSPYAGWPAARE